VAIEWRISPMHRSRWPVPKRNVWPQASSHRLSATLADLRTAEAGVDERSFIGGSVKAA
jgi:hypothetical protein